MPWFLQAFYLQKVFLTTTNKTCNDNIEILLGKLIGKCQLGLNAAEITQQSKLKKSHFIFMLLIFYIYYI